MFGKPQWFRPKRIGWGIVPVTWQGWCYTGAWAAVMVLPFLLLMARHQPVEAMLWMALSISSLSYDVWQILQTYRSVQNSETLVKRQSPISPGRDDRVLYIGDTEPVATRTYELCVRR